VAAIVADHGRARSEVDTAYAHQLRLQSDVDFAQIEKGADEQAHRANGWEMDPERAAQHAARIERTTKARNDAIAEVSAASAKAAKRRDVVAGIAGYINAAQGPFEMAAAPSGVPPKGKTHRQAVAAEREHQQERRALAARVKQARRGPADDLAAFISTLDRQAAEPPFRVVYSGGSWDLRLPVVAVNASPNGGDVPSAPDFRPSFIAEHRAEIIATAEEEIKGYYATNDVPVMPPEEQRARLREHSDEFLASERRECALIWAAREEGEAIDFRPDTDPRAVLGIEGPPPQRRR
jgi:hypothetical protein